MIFSVRPSRCSLGAAHGRILLGPRDPAAVCTELAGNPAALLESDVEGAFPMANVFDFIRVNQPAGRQVAQQQAPVQQQQLPQGLPQRFVDAFAGVSNALANISAQQANNRSAEDDRALSGLGATRQLNPLERGIGWLGNDFSEATQNVVPYDQENMFRSPGDFFANLPGFVGSLPFQMVAGASQAPANAYEFITRKPILDNPYTPEKEVDVAAGVASDEDLTFPQAAASGLNAVINTVGLGMGGSGRLIGGAVNAATRGAKAANMATGMFGRAMSSPAGRIAGQTAFDVAEEAGEEFVQSYLDDTRYDNLGEDSFDRALQASALGGLGGGVMSLGGRGLRHLAGKRMNRVNLSTQNVEEQTQVQDRDLDDIDYFTEIKRSGGTLDDMTQTKASLADSEIKGAGTVRPGSVNIKHSKSNILGDIDGAEISDDKVIAMWDNSMADRESLTKALGATHDEIALALFRHQFGDERYETAAQALNALYARKVASDGETMIGLSRNPDTHEGGFFLDLKGFVHGGVSRVSPLVYTLTGSDVDGDRSTVHFDTAGLNFNGYASEMLQHPEGRTNVDFAFSGVKSNTARSRVEDAVKAALGTYSDSDQDAVKRSVDNVMNALKRNDWNAVSGAFNGIRVLVKNKAMADTSLSQDEGERRRIARRMSRTAVNSLFENMRDVPYAQDMRDYTELFQSAASDDVINETLEGSRFEDVEKEVVDILYKSGTTGGSVMPVEVYRAMNLLSYAITGKKANLNFRQIAQVDYGSKDVLAFRDTAERLAKITNGRDVFTALMRAEFKMVDMGINPEMAIESKIQADVMSRTLAKFGSSTMIRSKSDIDTFLGHFVESWNEMTEVYNEAVKVLTTEGMERLSDSSWRNDMSGPGDAAIARNFIKVFGDMQMDELFDESLMPGMGGLSVKEYIEARASSDVRSETDALLSDDNALQQFINRLSASFSQEKETISKKKQELIKKQDLGRIYRDHYDLSGNLVNPEFNDREKVILASFIDGIAGIVGYRAALDMGLYGPAELAATRIGKMLYKGGDERINAVVALNIRGQYKALIDAYTLDESDPKKANAERLLAEKRLVSPIHELICDEILESGGKKHGVYDLLTNLDVSWSRKLSDFDDIGFNTGIVFPQNTDLFIDSIKSENSDFDISGISQQFEKVSKSWNKMSRAMLDNQQTEAQVFIKELDDMSDGELNAFIQYQAGNASTAIDLDILVHEVYDSMAVSIKMAEKGRNTDAGTAKFQSLEYAVDGGMTSVTDEMTALANGIIDADDFANNYVIMAKMWGDPKFRIKVVDKVTGNERIMSRDELIRDAYPEWQGGMITVSAFRRVLQKYPQTVDVFSHRKSAIGLSGREVSVSQSKTSSISQAFHEWNGSRGGFSAGKKSRTGDRILDREYRDAFSKMEVHVINQAWYPELLIRAYSAKHGGIPRNIVAPGQLARDIYNIHNGFVRYCMSMTSHRPFVYGSESDTRFDDFVNSVLKKNIAELGECVNIAYSEMMYGVEHMMSDTRFSDASEELSYKVTVLKHLNKSLEIAGVSSDLIENVPDRPDRSGYGFIEDQVMSSVDDISEALSMVNGVQDALGYLSGNLDYVRKRRELAKGSCSNWLDELSEKLKSTVDANDTDTIKLIDAAIDAANSEYDSLVHEAPSFNGMTFIDASAITKKNDLVKRVKEIAKDIGAAVDMTVENSPNGPIASCFDASGKPDNSQLKRYVDMWNQRVIEHSINSINDIIGTSMSGNLYAAENNMINNLASFFGNIRAESGVNYDISELSGDVAFPQLDFTDEVAEAMANNSRSNSNSAYVTTTVNVNGGAVKQAQGFIWLEGNSINPEFPQVSYTGNDVLNLSRDYDRCNAFIGKPGPDGVKWKDLRTVGAIKSMVRKGENIPEVHIYLPEDDPHGVYASNQMRPRGRRDAGFHRFSGILGIIFDEGQEGLVLKAKKALDTKVRVVDGMAVGDPLLYSISDDDLSDASRIRDAMRRKLLFARKEFADSINTEFRSNGRLAKIGFDLDQASIISRGLTPGYRLVLSNGVQVMIDARHLFEDDARFAAALDGILDKSGRAEDPSVHVVQATVEFVSINEASYRILRAIASHGYREDYDSDKMHESAMNAMTDWDGQRRNMLSVEKIMSRSEPIGWYRPSRLIATDSRTPAQYLQEYRYEGNASAYDPGRYSSIGSTKPLDTKGARYRAAVDAYGSSDVLKSIHDVAVGGKNLTVTQVFTNRRARAHGTKEELLEGMSNLIDVEDGHLDTKKEMSVGFLVDTESYSNAADWAIRNNNGIVMPKWIANNYNLKHIDIKVSANITSTESDRLVYVMPKTISNSGRVPVSTIESKRVPISKDSILVTLLDVANEYGLADAEVALSMAAANTKFDIGETVVHPFSHFFDMKNRNASQIRIMTRDEVKNIVEKGIDDGSILSKVDVRNFSSGIPADTVIRKLSEYIDNVNQKDMNNDSVIRRGIGGGDIMALMYDGVMVSPVILPNKAGRSISDGDIIVSNGNVLTGWSSNPSLGDPDNENAKHLLYDSAGKAISSITGKPMYSMFHGGHEIDCVISGETMESRDVGKDMPYLINNLRYGLITFGTELNLNPFLDIDKLTGTYRVKDDVVSRFQARYGDKWLGKLQDFLSSDSYLGDDSVWADVAEGSFLLSDDSSVNRIIKSRVRNCRRYHIPPMDIFSSVTICDDFGVSEGVVGGSFVETGVDINHALVFDRMNSEDVLKFYHFISPEICPDGVKSFDPQKPSSTASGQGQQKQTMFNQFGWMLLKSPDGTLTEYKPVRLGPNPYIGDLSATESLGTSPKHSTQHLVRRGMDRGVMDSEMKSAVQYAMFLTNNPEFVQEKSIGKMTEGAAYNSYKLDDSSETLASLARIYPHDSFSQLKHRKKVAERALTFRHVRRVLSDIDGEELGFIRHEDMYVPDAPEIKKAVSYFKSKTEWNGPLSWKFLDIVAGRVEGFTWNEETGTGNDVRVSTIARAIRDAADFVTNSNRDNLPVTTHSVNGKTAGGRYPLAMLSEPEMKAWWDNCKPLRDAHGSYDQFRDKVIANARKSFEQINDLAGPNEQAKRKVLTDAYDYDFSMVGEPLSGGYIYGGSYISDLVEARNVFLDAFRGVNVGGAVLDMDLIATLIERGENDIADLANRNESGLVKSRSMGKSEANPGEHTSYMVTDDGPTLTKVLNNLTQTTKFMSMLNPALWVSNVADMATHQFAQSTVINIANKFNIGPYKSTHVIDQELVNQVVNNPMALEIWTMIRTSSFTSDEISLLMNMGSVEEMRAFMSQRRKEMGRLGRAIDRMYGLMTGGNKFSKRQFRNFINRFVMFADADPDQQFWFDPAKRADDESESQWTVLEARLAEGKTSGSVKWLLELFGANNGRSPSFMTAMMAMNSARLGDLAQKNVFGMMLSEALSKTSIANFLFTTMVSKFPMYGLNITGRMLNWIMPVSSINYVITERIAEAAHEKAQRTQGSNNPYVDPHYEQAFVHTSLREAIMVDMLHFGVTGVAMVLIGLGAAEPPEDDDKWGNVDEWTIFGMRIGENWWLEDILGMALPVAAFAKSMQLGRPRFDILFNGLQDVCYNNPMIRVSDAMSFITDPEGALLSDYADDLRDFKNAKGGPPSLMDYAANNWMTMGLSYFTQFITPSFAKELYRDARVYETSYKKVYEETSTGRLTENGINGETEYTTYGDAMLRRLARKNPWVAILADAIIRPNTPYWGPSMPRVTYLDDYQLEAMEKWSISGLDEQAAKEKVLEIIIEIGKYDDMEELAATGFYLDGPTKAAVSSTVWDTIHEIDQWYYGMQSDGQFDYYTVGDGDFELGQERVGEIKAYYNQLKNYWNSFYYDKLRSSALSRSMVEYNRYNTTYAVDDNGEVYATGFRPQGFLPFVVAPGRIDDAEGTAGWENDWNSVSAVTGKPLSQRALVPVDPEYEEWPDIKSWSSDGDGGDYSDLYKIWYGSGDSGGMNVNAAMGAPVSPSTVDGKSTLPLTGLPQVSGGTSSGKGKTASSSYSRGGGYGGYSYARRSGSGGGGSYSPNIYSRYSAPNMSSPRVMDRVNLQRTNFDYLRPGFETKGSREAYKREDI